MTCEVNLPNSFFTTEDTPGKIFKKPQRQTSPAIVKNVFLKR